MKTNEKNLIVNKTFDFSIAVINYTEQLESMRKYSMARQLFRAGTSIGANTREAQHAESRADFIHKFKVAAKEAEETQYWLSLCKVVPAYPDCEILLQEILPIQKILTSIISSAKMNQENWRKINKKN